MDTVSVPKALHDTSALRMSAGVNDYKDWLIVDLHAGVHEGLSVNWSGWTGQRNTYTYDPAKHQGILFRGAGRNQAVIRPGPSASSAVHVGWGNVAFERLDIESGVPGGTIIWCSGFGMSDVALTLRHVTLTATGPIKWGLMHHNTDDLLEDVEVYCGRSIEHFSYGHGHGAKGYSYWSNVHVHGAGAECDKRVARPEEKARFHPNQVIVREDCVYEDWHQPHSGMGGGIVVQGAAAHLRVSRCLFRPSSRNPSKCLMVDDSFKLYDNHGNPYPTPRSFDIHTGQGITVENSNPSQCANGYVLVEECGIEGIGGQYQTPMVRVGPQGGGSHKLAQGFLLKGSGVYGPNTKVELIGVEKGPGGQERIVVSGCNTPEVVSGMRALGYQATQESILAVYGRPASLVSKGLELVAV